MPAAWTHALCVALLTDRILHALGVSRENEDPRLRVAAMVLTFSVLVTALAALLVFAR